MSCFVACYYHTKPIANLYHGGFTLLTNILSRSFIKGVFKLWKIKSIYCRYWGDVGSLGVYRYCGVYKGVSSKNMGFFYWKDLLRGGFNNNISRVICQYLVKLGVFFNIHERRNYVTISLSEDPMIYMLLGFSWHNNIASIKRMNMKNLWSKVWITLIFIK